MVLTRGKNKGKTCSKGCLLGYDYCKIHLQKYIKEYPESDQSMSAYQMIARYYTTLNDTVNEIKILKDVKVAEKEAKEAAKNKEKDQSVKE